MSEPVIDIDSEWHPPFEVPPERSMRTGASFVKVPVSDQVARGFPDVLEQVESSAKAYLKAQEVVWVQTLVLCPDEVTEHPYAECVDPSSIHVWYLIWVPALDVEEAP